MLKLLITKVMEEDLLEQIFKETIMEMAMEILVIPTVVQEEITIQVTTVTGMS